MVQGYPEPRLQFSRDGRPVTSGVEYRDHGEWAVLVPR